MCVWSGHGGRGRYFQPGLLCSQVSVGCGAQLMFHEYSFSDAFSFSGIQEKHVFFRYSIILHISLWYVFIIIIFIPMC